MIKCLLCVAILVGILIAVVGELLEKNHDDDDNGYA